VLFKNAGKHMREDRQLNLSGIPLL
jgi:hypothetical protein